MRRKFFLLAFCIFFSLPLLQAQSIHQQQLVFFDRFKTSNPQFWQKYWQHIALNRKILVKGQLKSIVFGWHPYWSNGLEDNYQWDLLSDLAYFGYEVDPQTGKPVDEHGWATANVITQAQQNGVRVHLTVILFSGHDQFFSSQAAQDTLINRLIYDLQLRHADGINLDFEGMGSDNRDQFTAFVARLKIAMQAHNQNWILSIALPAVDWYNVFDIQNLNQYVDLFIIMGYDYYWSGSSEAGPSGQLYTLSTFNYTETRSIVDYLHEGVPPEKLVLGVPYYGRKWQTQGPDVPSKTLSTGSVVLVKSMYSSYPKPKLDFKSRSQYLAYQSAGQWYQVWVDCDSAMTYKYRVVRQTGIAGIAIWALGYDDGYLNMWEKIAEYFTTDSLRVDTLWDLGGPANNYWDNEDYSFKVFAQNVLFDYISLEAGYDSLWIYDGQMQKDNLLAVISGKAEQKQFSCEAGYFTVRVKTDGRTTAGGWQLIATAAGEQEQPPGEVTVVYTDVYPNPVRYELKINNVPLGRYFTITDLKGRITKSGFYNSPISVRDLSAGIYVLRYYANKVYKFKFIKL